MGQEGQRGRDRAHGPRRASPESIRAGRGGAGCRGTRAPTPGWGAHREASYPGIPGAGSAVQGGCNALSLSRGSAGSPLSGPDIRQPPPACGRVAGTGWASGCTETDPAPGQVVQGARGGGQGLGPAEDPGEASEPCSRPAVGAGGCCVCVRPRAAAGKPHGLLWGVTAAPFVFSEQPDASHRGPGCSGPQLLVWARPCLCPGPWSPHRTRSPEVGRLRAELSCRDAEASKELRPASPATGWGHVQAGTWGHSVPPEAQTGWEQGLGGGAPSRADRVGPCLPHPGTGLSSVCLRPGVWPEVLGDAWAF